MKQQNCNWLVNSFHAPYSSAKDTHSMLLSFPGLMSSSLPISALTFPFFVYHCLLLAPLGHRLCTCPVHLILLKTTSFRCFSFQSPLISFISHLPPRDTHFFWPSCFLLPLTVPVYPTHTYTLVQYRLTTLFQHFILQVSVSCNTFYPPPLLLLESVSSSVVLYAIFAHCTVQEYKAVHLFVRDSPSINHYLHFNCFSLLQIHSDFLTLDLLPSFKSKESLKERHTDRQTDRQIGREKGEGDREKQRERERAREIAQ